MDNKGGLLCDGNLQKSTLFSISATLTKKPLPVNQRLSKQHLRCTYYFLLTSLVFSLQNRYNNKSFVAKKAYYNKEDFP